MNAIGTSTTANLRYVFPGNFTIATAATLNVGSNVRVLLSAFQTLTVDGTINFAAGDTVTLDVDAFNSTTQIIVNGTFNATGTVFNRIGGNIAGLTVNSGGRLFAASSTFALSRLTLNVGAVVNAGDLSNNAFDGPIFLPANLVPLFSAAEGGSDNLRFQDVNILAGTLNSGSLNLNAIGTGTTANLRYVFPGNFTVGREPRSTLRRTSVSFCQHFRR